MRPGRSPNTPSVRRFRPIMPFIHKLGPPAFRRRIIDFVPGTALKRMRDISDEIQFHARHIYESKKRAIREGDAAVTQQIGEGKDIMSRLSKYAMLGRRPVNNDLTSLLVQANMSANEEDKLPEDELLGQMAYAFLS